MNGKPNRDIITRVARIVCTSSRLEMMFLMLKPIKGYEGLYSIDENGNVYSVHKKIFLKWRDENYPRVDLRKHQTHKLMCIHTLVAEAFLVKPEGYVEINHKDGNKWNNNKDNLEWITPSENMLHAHRILHVKSVKGEEVGTSKLTEQNVIQIRNLRQKGMTLQKIADQFRINNSNVYYICSRKTWKHI